MCVVEMKESKSHEHGAWNKSSSYVLWLEVPEDDIQVVKVSAIRDFDATTSAWTSS
jgi:hypothetical protein